MRRPPHDERREIRRRDALRTAGAAGVLALMAPRLAQARAAASPAAIVAALRRGGHVVYFRHAATTRSGVDRIEWPRARQRLLSERGIEDSRRIGAAFQAHGIPVGEVLASPFARCRDMAEIAFGRVEERDELLGLLSDAAGHPERVAYLQGRLAAPPTDGTNRIVVAHRSNIQTVAGAGLVEGEGVVVEPLGRGRFRVLGTMRPRDWGDVDPPAL